MYNLTVNIPISFYKGCMKNAFKMFVQEMVLTIKCVNQYDFQRIFIVKYLT